MDIQKHIDNYINDATHQLRKIGIEHAIEIDNMANMIIEAFKTGHKLLICGNGGSAADAQHFAAELVVRLKDDRPALPAIALTTDTSIMTAASNDLGYDRVFERQVQAHGNAGDILMVISTSGNSKNLIAAAREAWAIRDMAVIGLLGNGGGELSSECHCHESIIIETDNTQHIQECHITIIHMLCEIIEHELFGIK